ncbi:MAG: transposase [Cypionkella sp.]|nr:transposase [Cypionkella sp.]
MRSAPGVGPVVATALLTELPEIGQIDGGAAAALAGLAPMARDNGLRSRDATHRRRGANPCAMHFTLRHSRPCAIAPKSATSPHG